MACTLGMNVNCATDTDYGAYPLLPRLLPNVLPSDDCFMLLHTCGQSFCRGGVAQQYPPCNRHVTLLVYMP